METQPTDPRVDPLLLKRALQWQYEKKKREEKKAAKAKGGSK